MQSPTLVLVFAQSGRFIAESATRAGYTVRVADCFGDTDTLAVAERWQPLPAFAELSAEQLLTALIKLSDNQACWLVCGTGIERFYPVLSQLPAHIQFAGNPIQSFAALRQPESFFSLLRALELPFPDVTFTPPGTAFLLKDMGGSGGNTIQTSSASELRSTQYYQHRIEGESYSVCFIADGQTAQILAWNRQHHRPENFTLTTLHQPVYPPAGSQPIIIEAVSKLTEACGLRGFNSLDYLIDEQGQVFILELNPRISASAELLSHADVFGWHLAACSGQLPDCEPLTQSPVRMLHYLFAERRIIIDPAPQWPADCHDLPQAGCNIEAGQPICTLIIEAESESESQQRLKTNIALALHNCHSRA
jgi:predicted ATP-grasp superfamily ATP-dependent carboligase